MNEIENMENEVWKDIEGYEGLYQVSDMGRVKSLDREITYIGRNQCGSYECSRIEYGRVMRSRVDDTGREVVQLRKDSKRNSRRIDILVAKEFLNTTNGVTAVKNIDGNMLNNKLSNIKWDDGIKSLDGEIWNDIPDFEGYYKVSNLGRVKGLARVITKSDGRILTFCEKLLSPIDNNVYPRVILGRGTRGIKKIRVHQLVARAFVSNPYNRTEVNHKDGNKSNPHYSNLEWVTRGENIQHAYDTGLRRTTPITGVNIKTGDTVEFISVEAAVRFLKIKGYKKASHSPIALCCKRQRGVKQSYGYRWEYQNKEVKIEEKKTKRNLGFIPISLDLII